MLFFCNLIECSLVEDKKIEMSVQNEKQTQWFQRLSGLRSGGRRQCRRRRQYLALPLSLRQDGGGLFLLVYLVLVLTFGFTLLTTDVAIGRRTSRTR